MPVSEQPRPRLKAKRAPRLPAHLLNVAHDSDAQSDKLSEQSPDASLDLQQDQLRSSEAVHRPRAQLYQDSQWDSFRMTHSPLMRSAIVQGSVPTSRVKITAQDTSMPVIRPVLGLSAHSSPPSRSGSSPGRLPPRSCHSSAHTSPLRQPADVDRNCKPPAVCAPVNARQHRRSENVRTLPDKVQVVRSAELPCNRIIYTGACMAWPCSVCSCAAVCKQQHCKAALCALCQLGQCSCVIRLFRDASAQCTDVCFTAAKMAAL
jgi:hypothetical protein